MHVTFCVFGAAPSAREGGGANIPGFDRLTEVGLLLPVDLPTTK